MAEIVNSLFGATPESIQRERNAARQQEALQYAKLDPFQRATAGIYAGAGRLGETIGGLLGGVDPEIQRASQRQELSKGLMVDDPSSYMQAAQKAAQMGDYGAARELSAQAQAMQLRRAQLGKTQAELDKLRSDQQQDIDFRNELAGLGEAPSQADILGVATKYGDANRVLAVIQGSSDKEAARQQALIQFREKLDNDARIAREKGESAAEQKQRDFENKKTFAQFAAALKGPSPAVLKAAEKADKIAEGQEGLAGTVEVARTLVNDLAKKGGMTTTTASPLANLVTSLGTGTIGQAGGRLFGTSTQSTRDELNSLRLQLFNAVKEATGMSSTQLNSNVELQTWLKSLGSDTMTKEANLAILNNISNRYLKKGSTKGEMPPSQEAVAAQPPMYAVNPTTKERIMSADGGKTWTKAR